MTHEVINQPVELIDVNLYDSDAALKDAVRREGAEWAANSLGAFGGRAGSAAYLELGALANRNPPELDTHDRYGRRVDLVRFHPAYHELMRSAIEEGIHSVALDRPARGRACRPRRALLHAEPGRGGARLPDHNDLRFLSLPASPARPRRRLAAENHRPRLRPAQRPGRREAGPDDRHGDDREAGRLGRARQHHPRFSRRRRRVRAGIRARRPQVLRLGADVRRLLVLAQAPGGLSCFLVPRWRPDGTKNPLQLIRLKRKMGNVSNASSETELRGALGFMVGPEGRGVATIIEMVAMTRFDCMIGSSAGMRAAVAQAIDHCRQRRAFGALLVDQPIMTAVLADLAIEAEAALALTMRIGRALDHRDDATRMRSSGSARRSASTGSASGRRATPTRRWNASAARA